MHQAVAGHAHNMHVHVRVIQAGDEIHAILGELSDSHGPALRERICSTAWKPAYATTPRLKSQLTLTTICTSQVIMRIAAIGGSSMVFGGKAVHASLMI